MYIAVSLIEIPCHYWNSCSHSIARTCKRIDEARLRVNIGLATGQVDRKKNNIAKLVCGAHNCPISGNDHCDWHRLCATEQGALIAN